MSELTVSVVIPNYNYGRFLSEAIESVLAQTFPCREIVVVDDGSNDDSLEILARYREKVRVVEQKNCGVGVARNTGVENSSGDVIAFLDADDYWMPNKIERQIRYFTEDEEVGLVSCGMREFNAAGETIHCYLESRKGWIAEEIAAFSGGMIVSGSAVAVRRDVFETVGGFDVRKELHPSEDWEFAYRVARESKIGFVPEILVNYRNHGANGHLKIPRMERAMLMVYEKIYRAAPPEIQKIKNDSYGNLYAVLAGSYFHAGNYTDFARTMAQSLRYKPGKIMRFLGFPLRFLQRRTGSNEPSSR